MNRLLTQDLRAWKNRKGRKPLLIDGARQVGKTYLVENIFAPDFDKVHKIDFLKDPLNKAHFEESLDPSSILRKLEIQLGQKINTDRDLLFFDEIGESQRATTALKYFAEDRPDILLCATGSNIGLLDSFPVGKVDMLELFPLCFEEFLMASDEELLLDAFRERESSLVLHDKLWSHYVDYAFVGGMPEAVAAWFDLKSESIIDRTLAVTGIHETLWSGYLRDFGKYGGKVNAQHIEAVFKNVPRQLQKNMDESVNRFKFKGVIERKKRYADLRGPIDWLEKTKLISKSYPIDCEPCHPLQSLISPNQFRLFFFDQGLLGHALEYSYKDHLDQKTSYKGFLAENFVQNELRVAGIYPTYSWAEGRSEIEFLHRCRDGEIIPIEVKSGKRTRAKSLRSYIDRYQPTRSIKLIGSSAGHGKEGHVVWPIYYASHVAGV